MISDRLNQEIWAIAYVSARAKKDRAKADAEHQFGKARIAQQHGDLDLFTRNLGGPDIGGMKHLQRGDRIANRLSAGTAELACVNQVISYRLLDLLHYMGIRR
jgi:hypothetical protein